MSVHSDMYRLNENEENKKLQNQQLQESPQ